MNTTNRNISGKNNEAKLKANNDPQLRGEKGDSLWRIEVLATGKLIGCVRAATKDDAMRRAYKAMIDANVIPPRDGFLITRTMTATGEIL